MWQIWLIAAGIFFVAEIITIGFLIFWLGIGALLAMIVSFFTSNILYQAYIFLISSTLLIIFTKPLVKKFKSAPNMKTNAFSVIDKIGIVTKEIGLEGKAGQVKLGSDIWTAVSATDELIEKGTEVIVEKIDGVKVIVRPTKVSSVIK